MNTAEFRNTLNRRYKNINVRNIQDNEDGSFSIAIEGNKDSLQSALNAMEKGDIESLSITGEEDVKTLRLDKKERGSLISRDTLSRSFLDLTKISVTESTPQELYEKAIEYYRKEDIYGSCVDLLTNFAAKGFKNEIDDLDIRNFYNNWIVDIGLDYTVDQLFFEFFRSGFVRTYKITAKYEPKINYVSQIPGSAPKKVTKDVASRRVRAAKKIKWSKNHLPIKYTILNPTLIEVDVGSLLFEQQLIKIKAKGLEEIKELLDIEKSKLTDHQKKLLDSLPSELKKAAMAGEDYPLNPYLVGEIDYRRQPYERYPIPRGSRAFEAIEYKRELRKADYSTLDGITNYILVITIGSDTIPVKRFEELEAVAELFNTPSKSFDVVWNHTLKVSRVEPSNIGDILGQDKYKQVNDDITGAFGVVRALIDGVGNSSKAALDIAVKSVEEEINYARRQVSRWIYREYRDVAEAMGFERFPKVRFDEMALKDELRLKSLIQGMIDRRIISYRTGHDELGYDHDTMVKEMEIEKPLVLDGTLGILGSPYQQAKFGGGVQPTQGTPTGTPSEGRPQNQVTKTPDPAEKPKKDKTEKQSFNNNLDKVMNDMSADELMAIMELMRDKFLEKQKGEV